MSTMSTLTPPPLEFSLTTDALKAIKALKLQITQIKEHCKEAHDVENLAIIFAPGFLKITTRVGSYGIFAEVLVDKIADIGPVLSFLAKEGYKRTQEPSYSKSEGTMYYFFGWLELTAKIIQGDENKTCRRVKVGSRVVEYPIYEVICPDESTLTPPAEGDLATPTPPVKGQRWKYSLQQKKYT